MPKLKAVEFLTESYKELYRIEWPSKQVTIRLTGFVIGVSLAVGMYIALLDYGLNESLTLLLNK